MMKTKRCNDEVLLSYDIIYEILSRLPPKTLLKLRCLSKSWYSTISNSNFIAKHLSYFANSLLQNNNNNENNEFLAIVGTQGPSLKLRQISEQNPHGVVDLVKHDDDQDITLLCQDDLAAAYYEIMGSCNGLFCYASFIVNDSNIFLCNPSIRRTYNIPPYPFSEAKSKYNNERIYSYGVGFDRFTNDYKVIKLSLGVTDNIFRSSKYPPQPREAALYSVKKNSWKPLKHVPPFSANGVSIFLQGFIHWLSYTSPTYENKKIMLFDVSNEVFSEMQLPGNSDNFMVQRPDYSRYRNLSISTVHGSLCVLGSEKLEFEGSEWIMKEYGVRESWTKQPTIEFKIGIETLLPFHVSTQATVGGKIVCSIDGTYVVLFDPQKVETVSLGEINSYRPDVVSLVPSLELLDITM